MATMYRCTPSVAQWRPTVWPWITSQIAMAALAAGAGMDYIKTRYTAIRYDVTK